MWKVKKVGPAAEGVCTSIETAGLHSSILQEWKTEDNHPKVKGISFSGLQKKPLPGTPQRKRQRRSSAYSCLIRDRKGTKGDSLSAGIFKQVRLIFSMNRILLGKFLILDYLCTPNFYWSWKKISIPLLTVLWFLRIFHAMKPFWPVLALWQKKL